MTRVAAWFLRFNALILLAYACGFIVDPALLGRLVGFTAHSPNTAVEITAFYGGLELGLAIYLIWGSLHSSRLPGTLMAFFVIFLSAGVFRVFGMVRFGFEDPSQPAVAAVEIVFALVAAALGKRVNKSLASS